MIDASHVNHYASSCDVDAQLRQAYLLLCDGRIRFFESDEKRGEKRAARVPAAHRRVREQVATIGYPLVSKQVDIHRSRTGFSSLSLPSASMVVHKRTYRERCIRCVPAKRARTDEKRARQADRVGEWKRGNIG